MKALRYGISGVFALGFAFIAACGGSADDNGSPNGAAGSAGRASGTAGTSSTSGGTTGSPGQTNNPAACPATAPANATACTLTGNQTTCTYTGMRCACARTSGGGGQRPGGMAGATASSNREWECVATPVCPATKPTVGEACTPGQGLTCPYSGMGSCSCSNRTSKWTCSGGNVGGGGAFNGTGGGFNGASGAFTGFAGAFTGVAGAFTGFAGRSGSGTAGSPSTGTTCPATKPAADTACTGTDACPYEGGGCVCSDDKWTCL